MIIGLFLPSRVTVACSLTIAQPAEKIFPWATEPDLWPQWTAFSRNPEGNLFTLMCEKRD